jgi:16S rRNA (guanine527-N7)-methyltransferase
MFEAEAKKLLKSSLGFSDIDIDKLEKFKTFLLEYNAKYNLISKSTENTIWARHILDSAQLLRYIDTNSKNIMADLGSGAGFPGLVISVFNKNPEFHVKLYEKSPVKREFLNMLKKELNLKIKVENNVYDERIDANLIVSRAFKKIDEILKISRETITKPHKIIILKGKNAEKEIKGVSLGKNYSYKLENSMTDKDSKIIIMKVS